MCRLRARFCDVGKLLLPEEQTKLSEYLIKDLGAPSSDECEFPYPNFFEYLEKRATGKGAVVCCERLSGLLNFYCRNVDRQGRIQ